MTTWERLRVAIRCASDDTVIAAGAPVCIMRRTGSRDHRVEQRFCAACARRIFAQDPPDDLPALEPERPRPAARAAGLPFTSIETIVRRPLDDVVADARARQVGSE